MRQECKCIDNSHNNINFELNRVYEIEENVGIWQPMLCGFSDWNNPGKLYKGLVFENKLDSQSARSLA